MPLSDEFDRAEGYGGIFALVKKAVEDSLGEHRVGLMLYLGNLPLQVGAFHPMGTNDIVLNRRLLEVESSEPAQKIRLFSVLLHEYLHSLGYADEHHVRGLTYRVCVENFGTDHPVVDAAISGPWGELNIEDFGEMNEELNLELIRDFERIDIRYII
jgi:hypothetical protein